MRTITYRTLFLSTALTLAGFGGIAGTAQAGPRNYASVQAGSSAVFTAQAEKRTMLVPYGKSATIDLPGGMMDVIVSNPDIVDAVIHTNNRVLLVGKRPGQTNVFFYNSAGQEIMQVEIRVERDMAGLNRLIHEHAPDAKVKVEAINNNILLSGSVPDAGTAKNIQDIAKMWLSETTKGAQPGEITNLLSIEGNQQVQLKVRIVEIQRSVTKQMGIDFSALGQLGDASIGLLSRKAINTAAGGAANLKWKNSGAGALQSLTSQLQALEKVGLVRTLAEPVLTTISGETANFLAGGEFPLLTNVFVDANGQVQREFEYKPYGVSLGFTPVVMNSGRISLNISTEVSEPTNEGAFQTGNGEVLAIRTRRANSVVELPAGGSMVIAGLIRRESRQSIEGTPGLKDIPGIGAMFRSRDESSKETELVIIVTPYLVKPTHPDKLQTPIDGLVPADDHEAVLMGRLNKVYGKNRKVDPKKYNYGPFGHVVD